MRLHYFSPSPSTIRFASEVFPLAVPPAMPIIKALSFLPDSYIVVYECDKSLSIKIFYTYPIKIMTCIIILLLL